MNPLKNFVIAMAGIAISMGTSILVALHGRGLEPLSWLVIIGGNFAGQLVAQLFIELAKSKD